MLYFFPHSYDKKYNATGLITFTEKTPPAFDKEKDNYIKWKKKFNLWRSITDVEKVKHGGLLTLRLDDNTQESVLETVSSEDLKKDTGADAVIIHLD